MHLPYGFWTLVPKGFNGLIRVHSVQKESPILLIFVVIITIYHIIWIVK